MQIERSKYMEKLFAFKDKRIIKVITGVRRCGKSTLLEIYQEKLLQSGITQEQITSVNFEEYDNAYLTAPDTLYAFIKNRLCKDKISYIFLDEIQHVTDFPRIVDSLFLKKNVDIYITGSNAYMLSSEIATLLSGRYVEIRMLPLSFREYVQTTGDNYDLPRKYTDYLDTSSFPYVLELEGRQTEIHDYLQGLYNTIIMKDIMARKKIFDPMMLDSVIRFVFDIIGNLLSTKKIADTMSSSGRKIDVKTVDKYMNTLIETFIVYQAKRYDIRGKQYLKTLEKYYVVDIGLRSALLGSRAYDAGHILENVVYLELIRRGFDVYIGKFDGNEIDFITISKSGLTYYQVAATVRDENTLHRELRSLRNLRDHYPKYLLSLDEDPDADYDGIIRTNVLKWLIND
ncbi:MAG: ATP-binding protein [Sphaerochaetaceae bacterium]